MNGSYCIYLRKSRADKDSEAHGEGETLARHESMLLALSSKMDIKVDKIYREIVSGETIAARPYMQELLSEVEQGVWAGVLVVEVERLARGNTKDQGIVAEAFKFGNCKIITPVKTYDPENEFDEEYFEFGLFMSRREYKTINRRIQRGRLASLDEGKYIAGTAPFGYNKVRIKNDKGWTLEIIEEEAEIVNMIYSLYTKGEMQEDGTFKQLGHYLIAKKLDGLGLSTRSGHSWSRSTIKDILTNPTYIGKVIWSRRPIVKKINDGVVSSTRSRTKDYKMIDGLHPAIIDTEVFNAAQKILNARAIHPIVSNSILKNPLSGLVVCGKCGSLMTRTSSNTKEGYFVLSCPNRECDNVQSAIYLIEQSILKGLSDWVENYNLKSNNISKEPESISFIKEMISKANVDLSKLELQLNTTYDLLEQGVYSLELFKQRNGSILIDIAICKNQISSLHRENEIVLEQEKAKNTFIPSVKNILSIYDTLESPQQKNVLLKEVIETILYTKTERGKKGNKDEVPFILDISPVLQIK